MRANLLGSALLLAVLFAYASGSHADTIRADSDITDVTVFIDRAEVTRRVTAQIGAGQHTLVISGLPASLVLGSLRASTEAARIERVALSERAAGEAMREDQQQLIDEKRALQLQHRTLADVIAAQEIKLELVRSIGQAQAQDATSDILANQPEIASWQTVWEAVTEGAGEALQEIRSAEQRQQDLEREIERIDRQLELIGTGRQTVFDGLVDLSLEQETEIELDLVYQVGDAGWQPGYQLDLDTDAGELQVTRQAMIRQASGENWQDVAMTLSTAMPGRYAAVPELQPWFIDIRPPEVPRSMAEADVAKQRFSAEAAAPPVRIDAGEFFALYQLDRPASVPSDRSTHVITLALESMPVELDVLSAPLQSPHAILTGEIASPVAAPLLAGEAQIFRDGTFVADTWIDSVQPGETVRLSYGVDDRVRVSRRLDTGGRSSTGIIRNRRRTERIYLIDVANNHAIPVEITVLDRLPVSQDDRIEVSMLQDSTQPTEVDVDGRRGVVAWSRVYEPGEQAEIRFGFAVTRPDDVEVPGF